MRDMATYKITGNDVAPLVMVDCDSGRQFQLRRKTIFSSVLVENDLPVVTYVPRPWGTKYRVTAKKDTPQSVILLSVWMLMKGVWN